jgi:hypothetical protein
VLYHASRIAFHLPSKASLPGGINLIRPVTAKAREDRRQLGRLYRKGYVEEQWKSLDDDGLEEAAFIPKPEPLSEPIEIRRSASLAPRPFIPWDLNTAIGLWRVVPYWWSFSLAERGQMFPETERFARSLARSMPREVPAKGVPTQADRCGVQPSSDKR